MPLRPASITPPVIPAPAGAAGAYVVHWPHDLGDQGGGIAVTKFGGAAQDGLGNTAIAGGTATTSVDDNAGCIRWNSGAAGQGIQLTRSKRVSWYTEQTQYAMTDPDACWQVAACMRWPVIGVALSGDIGIQISTELYHSVNGDGASTNPGIIFGPVGPGLVAFRARAVNGGPLTINYQIPAAQTPDLTRWATYAVRIVSGALAQDPYAVGMIAGVEVTPRYPWTAAGAVLPKPGASAGQYGYVLSVCFRPNALLAYQSIKTADFVGGATLAALA